MPAFSGGVSVDKKGYLVLKAGPHRDRRVHDMIAEAILGRKLKPYEEAHHKDENKLNCSWDNIEVIDTRTHGAVSSRQYWYLKTHVWEKEQAEWDAYFAEANTSVYQSEFVTDGQVAIISEEDKS